MFCKHCHTPFEIIPIDEGKSKYCKKCGKLIYKKENNAILIYQPEIIAAKHDDEELEIRELIIREKELRYKEQVERKQKEQEFRERLDQIRLLKEKEEQEKKRKEKEEQERLFQLQLEEEKRIQDNLIKTQLEKERLERERLEKELQLEEQLKNEQLERDRVEKEIQLQVKLKQEQLQREELEKELQIQEQLKQELVAKEKQERDALQLAFEQKIKIEKDKLAQERIELDKKEKEILQKKETAQIQFAASQTATKNVLTKNIESPITHRIKYVALLLAGIFLATAFMYLKNKISFLTKNKNNTIALASVDSNIATNNFDYNTDTVLLTQLRTNLIERDILSWNKIREKDIKNITILRANENDANSQYTIAVNLADGITKATAELNLSYNKIILNKIETVKITYTNVAPINAWFSFVPLANCSISINTNNNPIQLKTCDDCTISKIISTKDSMQTIANSEYIYIKSDTRYEAYVEFMYVPINN